MEEGDIMQMKVGTLVVTILRRMDLNVVADVLENGRPANKPQPVPIRIPRRIERPRPLSARQQWRRPDMDPHASGAGCVQYRPHRSAREG
jgi:hypothetical protein